MFVLALVAVWDQGIFHNGLGEIREFHSGIFMGFLYFPWWYWDFVSVNTVDVSTISFLILGYMLPIEHMSCVITNCAQHQWVILYRFPIQKKFLGCMKNGLWWLNETDFSNVALVSYWTFWIKPQKWTMNCVKPYWFKKAIAKNGFPGAWLNWYFLWKLCSERLSCTC